jgi:hypothetical protein
MALPSYVFFDGKIVPYAEAKVGILTHGLNYGTAVFVATGTTMRMSCLCFVRLTTTNDSCSPPASSG